MEMDMVADMEVDKLVDMVRSKYERARLDVRLWKIACIFVILPVYL